MDSPRLRHRRPDRNLVIGAETVVPEGREDPDPAVPGREAAGDSGTGTGGPAQAAPAPAAAAPGPEDPVRAPAGPRSAGSWAAAAAPIASATTGSTSYTN